MRVDRQSMMDLREQYTRRYEHALVPMAKLLENHLKDNLKGLTRIDRIAARAKSIDRFMNKAAKETDGRLKYSDPLSQIQDQIGARVVTFYLDDVETVSKEIEAYYRNIESRLVVPDSESEFGYFGKHYILLLPEDLVSDDMDRGLVPKFFELQIKTLFQHAWSEANHDLGYKPEGDLQSDEKRKIAFTAAQAWGADQMFAELFRLRNN